jgi:hypothetical protein
MFTSAVLLVWVLSQGVTLIWLAAMSAAALGMFLGWRALREVGTLTWDGQVWCLHDQGLDQEDALGGVRVALDV